MLKTVPVSSTQRLRNSRALLLIGLWLAIFFASLFTPPLLDDADATHAQAAQAMLRTGDLVTLHVDGVRYLEKPPLPYWMAALSLRLFASGESFERMAAFAIHLPLALTVLALAGLGGWWSRYAFGDREWGEDAAFYSSLFVLTSAGVFLFTRVFIPDALLSLLLAFSLFAMLRATDPEEDRAGLWAYAFWIALALAVLAKGLVALVFLFGTALIYLALCREAGQLRRLRPLTGAAVFLAVAAPWHILAGVRNRGGAGGHGFFWFYLVNEHLLRFLGRRIPRDYNKLPGYLYWALHLVWLFPWSLFVPAAVVATWQRRLQLREQWRLRPTVGRAHRTLAVLLIFSALVLVFFSLSTNQEYYTFPVYLPLLMLVGAALAAVGRSLPPSRAVVRALGFGFAAFTVLGAGVAALLGYGLITSRRLAFNADIGSLLAYRNVGGYTLSMSHFFDLTGPSFAALRLPAALALGAFVAGPGVAWWLWRRGRLQAGLVAVSCTSAVFLVAAHLALVRFSPMLSSAQFASSLERLQSEHRIAGDTEVLLFGDQAYGSSIPFYLRRRVELVDGRSTSMLFGSTFADAPPIFLTPDALQEQWGRGPRKILFVPQELSSGQRQAVRQILGSDPVLIEQSSGKALYTDRPLAERGGEDVP